MAKKQHVCTLKVRQVKVTNLNYSPEKKGNSGELMPRVDLSMEMIVDELDLEELVRVRTGANVLKALWDKAGQPLLLDVKPLTFDIEFKGTAELRFVNDEENRYTFNGARIKSLKVEPQTARQAEINFQLRVDPGEYLDELGDMRLAQRALLAFTGHGDDEPDSGKQQELAT